MWTEVFATFIVESTLIALIIWYVLVSYLMMVFKVLTYMLYTYCFTGDQQALWWIAYYSIRVSIVSFTQMTELRVISVCDYSICFYNFTRCSYRMWNVDVVLEVYVQTYFRMLITWFCLPCRGLLCKRYLMCLNISLTIFHPRCSLKVVSASFPS